MARIDNIRPQNRHRDRFDGCATVPGYARGDGETLAFDLLLHRDQSIEQCLRSWRAAGNINIDGDIFIDPAYDVIAFLKWPPTGSARTHRQHILGFWHLVV